MKSVAILELCDNHLNNRMIERISADVKSLIDWGTTVNLKHILIDCSNNLDKPEAIQFPEYTMKGADILWLAKNQDIHRVPIIEQIQLTVDNGDIGLWRGFLVPLNYQLDLEEEYDIEHIAIEVRHIH